MSQIDRTLAEAARAWPFEEARKLVARTGGKAPAKGYVLFETGYGPSGLPHIGTFGEVVRTTMVRQRLPPLSDVPTRLFASPTTWTACARCRTTCRTRRCWRPSR
jgi:lysyl-tRNA synthetase class 1